MRAALIALAAIGTLSAIDIAPAEARDYAYCMRTRYDTDQCTFDSFQQCQWTSSGLGTTCFANPALAYNRQYIDEQPAPRRRHHRHHRAY
jgi:hypothetical protein